MLSLFALPKGFQGHTAVIQRNALRSWSQLQPEVEVVLFGDDPGVAEAAREFGLRLFPEIARNDFGTPLVSDLFQRAQKVCRHPFLCYANADIIFGEDLPAAVSLVAGWRRTFLLAGQRWNLDLREPLDFSPGWQERLRARVRSEGEAQGPWWIDYFVFPRGTWTDMPPFAIGRPTWDNWLIYDARRRRIPVVDASAAITAVHQSHDYAHVPQATGDHWLGPEADRNFLLAGGRNCAFTLLDATHRLTDKGVRRSWSFQSFRRAFDRLASTSGLAAGALSALRGAARGFRRGAGSFRGRGPR